jgi:hypothetical protein
MLTTAAQGRAADAMFVKWLMEHQREAGVFTTVTEPASFTQHFGYEEDD